MPADTYDATHKPYLNMDSESIKSSIRQIIHEATNIPTDTIAEDVSFQNDLEIDSLTLLEIAVSVDQKYGLKLPEEEMIKLDTLNAILEAVLAHSAS